MPKILDPLMGWTGSRDTMQQVQLWFHDPRRGQGARREERLAVHRRAAAPAARPAQGLRRQLRLQPTSGAGRIERDCRPTMGPIGAACGILPMGARSSGD